MNMFVLTMVLVLQSNGPAMTTIQQEYTSKQKCEDAMSANRESLRHAGVILATCTPK